jgi:hypothetical protein
MFKKLRRSRTALVGVCCALVGAAVVPVVGLATISGSTGDGPMVVQSGQTLLAYSAKQNVSSVDNTAFYALWSRVGDTVTMTGTIPTTVTTGGTVAKVYIPLPIDSDISYNTHCQGTVASSSTSGYGGVVGSPDVCHLHECILSFTPSGAGLQYFSYSLSYRVRG